MYPSLLPPNRSQLEADIEQLQARLADIPVDIRDLWRAETCPLSLLPWLAWGLSIDEWDSHWEEQTKRDVVSNSIALHRKKGTVWAVKRALNLCGASDAVLSEWYEPTGSGIPRTFWITLPTTHEAISTAAKQETLLKMIDAAKPIAAHRKMVVQDGQAEGEGIDQTATVYSPFIRDHIVSVELVTDAKTDYQYGVTLSVPETINLTAVAALQQKSIPPSISTLSIPVNGAYVATNHVGLPKTPTNHLQVAVKPIPPTANVVAGGIEDFLTVTPSHQFGAFAYLHQQMLAESLRVQKTQIIAGVSCLTQTDAQQAVLQRLIVACGGIAVVYARDVRDMEKTTPFFSSLPTGFSDGFSSGFF